MLERIKTSHPPIILIVDDQAVIRLTYKTLLSREGYDLNYATSGAEAIKKAVELMPDLILLDVLMRDMTGYEVCQKLRNTPKLSEVPIILVTALDDRESRLKGIEAGADDFITKPFDAIELSTRIRTITRLNRYRRLVAERLKFERMVDLAPIGIIIVDAEGVIQLINPTMRQMLSCPADTTIIGKLLKDYVAPISLPTFEKYLKQSITTSNQVLHKEMYFVKRSGSPLLTEVDISFFVWNNQSAVQIMVHDITERKQAERVIQQANQELAEAYHATLEGWSRALELRDRETEGHTKRVTNVTVRLAHKLGIRGEDLTNIYRGAVLHDIGKMGIPDRILLKTGPLTPQERAIIRKHPMYAYEMLKPINYLRPALDIPRYHHERWDGAGYPTGLKDKNIPLPARIFAVVDVWDALRSDRPYHKAWPEEKVRAYLKKQAGSHFDPHIVEVFLQLLEETTFP